MIIIDGSYGEGGGQILRTSIAMSVVTGEAVKIKNIRQNRPNPGIREQHLEAIKALAKLTGSHVSGIKLGSKEIEFIPENNFEDEVKIKVRTAGSLGLVLQPIMIASSMVEKEIRIKLIGGGTWGKWAPPLDYIRLVLIPFLERFGYNARLDIKQHGFYPKGGGIAELLIREPSMGRINTIGFGKLRWCKTVACGSSKLKERKVLERMVSTCKKEIFERYSISPETEVLYQETESTGCGVLNVFYGDGIQGPNALCKLGTRAEDIARSSLEFNPEYALDKFLGDQIIPYIAIFGGDVDTTEITEHAKTNAWVCNNFVESIDIKGNEIHGKGFA